MIKAIFMLFITINLINGYSGNAGNRYFDKNADKYRTYNSIRFNEPAFSIKNNLKERSYQYSNYDHTNEEKYLGNSRVAQDLENNAVSFLGAQPVIHESRPVLHTVHPRPVHVSRPAHIVVIEEEPHLTPAPQPSPASEPRPKIDPFIDDEAKKIAREEESILTEVEREESYAKRAGYEQPAATEFYNVNLNLCPCKAAAVPTAMQFFEEPVAETKHIGAFAWWLLPLLILGLLLIAILLALFFQNKKPTIPTKKFVIERKVQEEDEKDIEDEIEKQLKAKIAEQLRKAQDDKSNQRVFEPAATNAAAPPLEESPSRDSYKKVVKKRIVKMMKDGKLVAEKEEILDEEGNVLQSHIRKEYD